MRKAFEVRIREKVAPYKWVLKSKFYFVNSAGDARAKYKGSGQIIRIEKVTREKAQGIGAFFSLGDKLLREFAEESQREKERVEGGENSRLCSAEFTQNGLYNDGLGATEALLSTSLDNNIKKNRRFNEQRNKTTN